MALVHVSLDPAAASVLISFGGGESPTEGLLHGMAFGGRLETSCPLFTMLNSKHGAIFTLA